MDIKASLDTLPFELKEQIFEYLIYPGPQVNIIIRDTAALEEENHFNILPKNPPHPFARHKCDPKHKAPLASIQRRRECLNKDYKVPQKQAFGQHRFGVSVIYQISPIPANILCLSRSIQVVISSIWRRVRRSLKEILDKHILLKGKTNLRHCGCYEMIWFTDFLGGRYSREVEDLFRNRCRYIFDLDITRSLHATWSTMSPEMRDRIQNIVFSRDMVPDPDAVRDAFQNLKSIGIMMGNSLQAPDRTLSLFASRNITGTKIHLELLRTGNDIGPSVETGARDHIVLQMASEEDDSFASQAFDPLTTSSVGIPRRYKVSTPGRDFEYELHPMPRMEVHDRGRYIFNTFHKTHNCYYQGRGTAEELVYVVKLAKKRVRARSLW